MRIAIGGISHESSTFSAVPTTLEDFADLTGLSLAEGPYEDVSKNPQVMEAYMGTADAALEGH